MSRVVSVGSYGTDPVAVGAKRTVGPGERDLKSVCLDGSTN